MSKVGLHNHIGYYGNVNYTMMNNVIYKLYKQLRVTDDTFKVVVLGHEIDCRPFLCNAVGLFPADIVNHAMHYIVRKAESRVPVTEETLKRDMPDFDMNLLRTLLPIFDCYGIQPLSVYGCYADQSTMARLFFQGGNSIIQSVLINKEHDAYDFKDRRICNTQAFSYYMVLYWMLKVAPAIRVHLSRQIGKLNFDDIFNKYMPEGCLHRRWLNGDIDSAELRYMYTKSNGMDFATPQEYEIMSLFTCGAYDGYSLSVNESHVLTQYSVIVRDNFDIELNKYIGYFMFLGTRFSDIETERDSALSKVEQLKTELSSISGGKSRAQEDARKLREENAELKDRLKSAVSADSIKDIENKYSTQIRDLKQELKSQESGVDYLLADASALRREVKQLKREIKRLQSSPQDSVEISDDLTEEVTESAKELLKDYMTKCIVIVGDDEKPILKPYLDSLGFTKVIQFSNNTQHLKRVDIVIIVTQHVSHSLVLRCLSMVHRSKVSYWNGRSLNGFDEYLLEELKL